MKIIKTILLSLLFIIAYTYTKTKNLINKKIIPFIFNNGVSIIEGFTAALCLAIISFFPAIWAYCIILVLYLMSFHISKKSALNINKSFWISYVVASIFYGFINMFFNKITALLILFYFLLVSLAIYDIKKNILSLELSERIF